MTDDQQRYENLNMEARNELASLACKMHSLLRPGDVAANFLGAGLAVLLTLGDDVARQWLEKALDALRVDSLKKVTLAN
jgi:hypothetical protein